MTEIPIDDVVATVRGRIEASRAEAEARLELAGRVFDQAEKERQARREKFAENARSLHKRLTEMAQRARNPARDQFALTDDDEAFEDTDSFAPKMTAPSAARPRASAAVDLTEDDDYFRDQSWLR